MEERDEERIRFFVGTRYFKNSFRLTGTRNETDYFFFFKKKDINNTEYYQITI